MGLINFSCLLVFCFLSKVFTSCLASDIKNCSSSSIEPKIVHAELQNLAECVGKVIDNWNEEQVTSVLDSLQTAIDLLNKKQRQRCEDVVPKECPAPLPPSDGGLVCVTFNETRYCKPMCNQEFDFAFLRRSRLYETCGKHNKNMWSTQYIGGNTLAVCNKSTLHVSGVNSTYFPKDQDCKKTKYGQKQQIINTFIQELADRGIEDNHKKDFDCLMCG
uniref:Si:ch1073-126c3.2 n=1 Tax=Lepisosteus oculatus TaxID=7918 RepID=W5N5M9_LEPOC|nr:PREDICTED: uncharacterized protein LOC107077408 [Lepisosteus oculatus]